MSSWARVGVKCVCIKKTPWMNIDDTPSDTLDPAHGQVCKIVDIGLSVRRNGEMVLKLKGHGESRYPVQCFRPLAPPAAKTQDEDVARIKKLVASRPELVE